MLRDQRAEPRTQPDRRIGSVRHIIIPHDLAAEPDRHQRRMRLKRILAERAHLLLFTLRGFDQTAQFGLDLDLSYPKVARSLWQSQGRARRYHHHMSQTMPPQIKREERASWYEDSVVGADPAALSVQKQAPLTPGYPQQKVGGAIMGQLQPPFLSRRELRE